MLNIRKFILTAVFTVACTGTSTDTTDPARIPDNSSPTFTNGELAVSVAVTGDPTTAPRAFTVALGTTQLTLAPNEAIQSTLNEGYYRIKLSYWGGGLAPAWCWPVGSIDTTIHVSGGKLQTMTFSVNCPALIGTGHLKIKVNAPALAKTPFQVTVTRITPGPAFSTSFNVASNDSAVTDVPVGVHRISIKSQNCSLTGVYALLGIPGQLVRDGQTSTTTITLGSCVP